VASIRSIHLQHDAVGLTPNSEDLIGIQLR
jgi:hypothetical protein